MYTNSLLSKCGVGLYKWASIGAGVMANAIVKSAQKSGFFSPEKCRIYDIDSARLAAFPSDQFDLASSSKDAIRDADFILLAVKPDKIDSVLSEIAEESEGKCFVSIAAGITIDNIRSYLPISCNVIRIMPNLPITIGSGATVISCSNGTPDNLVSETKRLFECAGEVCFLDESLMNPVIAVNGSSPAFFFRMLDVMSDAAAEQGIDKDIALILAALAMQGSAKLLIESGKTPKELIKQVAVPGGTTAAALHDLDELYWDDIIKSAMKTCTKRADELNF